MSGLSIRDADPARDAPACAAIYAPYVETTPISFEERPPEAGEMASRIERVIAGYPWLIGEAEGETVGYAYASRLQERPAYRWAAEVSVYVASEQHGRGYGQTLYEALFERLRQQRLQVAWAGITLPNEASVRLHERLGFTRIGISQRIGWKAGRWHDVSWWQMELTPAGTGPPPEPLPPGPPPSPGYH